MTFTARGGHIDVGGHKIWYEEWGERAGIPVFLCQRMGALTFEWEPAFIDALVAAGYRVIGHDLRGFGYSEPGEPDRYGLRHLVDDALAVIDGLGLGRLHLVGTSVGGVLARWMALTRPSAVQSLTLMSTSTGDPSLPVWTPAFSAVAANPPGPSVDERIDYIIREIAVVNDRRVDLAAARRRATETVRRGWHMHEMRRLMRASNKRAEGELEWQNTTPIDAPIFVAHGTIDSVLPIVHGYALKELYPQAELLVIYGMSHELQAHYVPRLMTYWLPFLRAADRVHADDYDAKRGR